MKNPANLHSHIDLCGLVNDFAHGTIVSLAELILEFKLIHTDAKGGTTGEIYALCVKNGLAIEIQGTGRVATIKENP